MAAPRGVSKIRKEYAENAAVLAITDDLENYASLAAIVNQEGGKLLISGLVDDTLASIERVANGYKTLTHAELMGACAGLKANLDVLRVLTRAEKNRDLAKDALEEAIKA